MHLIMFQKIRKPVIVWRVYFTLGAENVPGTLQQMTA